MGSRRHPRRYWDRVGIALALGSRRHRIGIASALEARRCQRRYPRICVTSTPTPALMLMLMLMNRIMSSRIKASPGGRRRAASVLDSANLGSPLRHRAGHQRKRSR